MTPAEQARWFIQHPVALGHALGFKLLREYPHGEWLRWMIHGTDDGTLQAHRGGYKTTCLELAIPLLMVRYPERNTIFLRKTDTDVAEVIAAVDKILRHPVFRQIFHALTGADLQVTKSNSSEITTNLYDAPKGSSQLLGIGIGGSLTGKHADLLITDDIVNLKDRISRAERDRTKAIYQELQNIRNPGGRIINTGTPWHKEDAFTLMPDPMKYDWKQTGMLTEEQAEKLRSSMSYSLFAANYELRHIAVENALFTAAPVFTSDPGLLRDGRAHIDAAYGGEDYTAYTAGIRRGDTLYLYGRLWHRHVDEILPEALVRGQRGQGIPGERDQTRRRESNHLPREREQAHQDQQLPQKMVAENRLARRNGPGIPAADHGLHRGRGARRRAGQRRGDLQTLRQQKRRPGIRVSIRRMSMEKKLQTATDPAVQELIRNIVNDTIAEKDRTVTIRIDPDGAISVSIYPTIN